MALDEQHAFVRQHGQLDRLIELFGEHDAREAIFFGPRAVEIDRSGSNRVAQAAEQVLQEERLGVGGFGVAHVGVPRAAAGEIVVPAHGVVIAVGSALVALLVDLDEHVDRWVDRLEVVELVFALEVRGEPFRRHVRRVEYAVAAFADVGITRMAVEVRARQSAVPRPVVLGVGGGVHADVSAPRLDVALEDVLLRRIQHVARRTQEDDGAIARQVFLREGAGILRRVDRESILLAELLDCGDAVGDGAVPECGGLGEDEHAWLLRRRGDRNRKREANEKSMHGRQSAWSGIMCKWAAIQPSPFSENESRHVILSEARGTRA